MAFKRNGGSVKIHYRKLVCGILNARASAVSHSARRTPATERGGTSTCRAHQGNDERARHCRERTATGDSRSGTSRMTTHEDARSRAIPLHPEYQAMLRQAAEANAPPLVELPVDAGRRMFRAMQPEAPDVSVGAVTDTRVTDGVPVRVYAPRGQGPFPVVMMFHGGGWVLGDLATADCQSRLVCNGTDALVVSVDYRLAPEHRFPVAADDCYRATEWAASNAGAYGGDPDRLALVGDSAGGNLAAVVAQMARDRGGPDLVFQLLIYPAVDARMNYASCRDNAEGYLLTTEAMRWFWNHYAPNERDRLHPYASPLLAADLGNLPPALVLTAEFDPLRDEGEAYADALAAAGVTVEKARYDGFHSRFL